MTGYRREATVPIVYGSIVERCGYGGLNQLLRAPARFEEILWINKAEFSREWNGFIDERFRRGET